MTEDDLLEYFRRLYLRTGYIPEPGAIRFVGEMHDRSFRSPLEDDRFGEEWEE